MKIAAVTDDGQIISRHFGRASHYLVLTVEDGRVVARELRDKLGHAQFAQEGHEHHEHSHGEHEHGHAEQGRGRGPGAAQRHARMAEAISDCQVLLCGGMGMGAYESLQQVGIRPMVVQVESIEEAVTTFLEGRLEHQSDLLH